MYTITALSSTLTKTPRSPGTSPFSYMFDACGLSINSFGIESQMRNLQDASDILCVIVLSCFTVTLNTKDKPVYTLMTTCTSSRIFTLQTSIPQACFCFRHAVPLILISVILAYGFVFRIRPGLHVPADLDPNPQRGEFRLALRVSYLSNW